MNGSPDANAASLADSGTSTHRRSRAAVGALISVLAVAALSLLAAGCGGGGNPGVASVASSTVPPAAGSPATTSPTSGALHLVGQCIRAHGIPDFPDPTVATSGPAKGKGILDKQDLRTVAESVVNQALAACQTAVEQADISTSGPNSGPNSREIQNLLAFARCIRNHGITNFPDPDRQGGFNLAGTGIDTHELSPAELAAARTCLPTARGDISIPPQGESKGNSSQ
jgi:hypothetical protein